ncbi:MAG TPA: hypothetical protein VEL28_02625 [Candidatus Binatia bacterium]|nr:hypothetical protein [Candidatus Binatia bacterium]
MNLRHISSIALAATLGVAAVSLTPSTSNAQVHVDVGISIPLPPPLILPAPPQLVVLPGTYVYAVPDYGEDLFFVDGYWWRPYGGRWYRSRYYDRDWGYYSGVPTFYSSIPRTWRSDYRNRRWHGRTWNHERLSYDSVRNNWSNWRRERRWDTDRITGDSGGRNGSVRSGAISRDGRREDSFRDGRDTRRPASVRDSRGSDGGRSAPAQIHRSQPPAQRSPQRSSIGRSDRGPQRSVPQRSSVGRSPGRSSQPHSVRTGGGSGGRQIQRSSGGGRSSGGPSRGGGHSAGGRSGGGGKGGGKH